MLKLNHMLFKHKYINAKGNQDELLQIQRKVYYRKFETPFGECITLTFLESVEFQPHILIHPCESL